MNDESTTMDGIRRDMKQLTETIGCRPVGSLNNQNAAAYIAQRFAELGWETEQQEFSCDHWEDNGASLSVNGQSLPARVNFFSPPVSVTAPMAFFDRFDQLTESPNLREKIIVLHGEITQTSIMPINFKFYNPPEHQQLNTFLKRIQPPAVIAVSHMQHHPAPIFEDGDFPVPSATISRETGQQLLRYQNEPVSLSIASHRRPSSGTGIIARRQGKLSNPQSAGNETKRKKFVLCGHMDTKHGTPGALDNASGVAIMLNIAERLNRSPLHADTEIIPFNGEDCYNTPSQLIYLDRYMNEFPQIIAVINADGVGAPNRAASIAYFQCPEKWIHAIESQRNQKTGFVRVDPWPSGDHSIFWPHNVPAIALSSDVLLEWIDTVIHTPLDNHELPDPHIILATAEWIEEILHYLDQNNV